MKKIRIKKVQIYNFKKFNDVVIDFENSDVVILDGPNGFGKTTLFDALELLLTGEVNRIVRKENDVDSRRSFKDNVLVNDENNNLSFIKAHVEIDGVKHFICRYAIWDDKFNNNPTDFTSFKLVKLKTFEEEIEEKNFEDSSILISEYLGDSFRASYPVMHYIEQDESSFLLKRKVTARTQFLSYLFKTDVEEEKYSEYKNKIDHIKTLKKELDKGITTQKRELKSKKESLISTSSTKIDYQKLFNGDDWDAEEIKFGVEKWMQVKKPEIEELIYLIENRELYINKRINDFIQSTCVDNGLIEYTLVLHPIKNEIDILKANEKSKKNITFFRKKLDLTSSSKESFFQNDFNEIQLLLPQADQEFCNEFKSRFASLKQSYSTLKKTEKNMGEIRDIRSNLLSHISNDGDHEECLFCGHNYESTSDLLANVNDYTSNMDLLLSTQLKKFQEEFDVFSKSLVSQLDEKLKSAFDRLEKKMSSASFLRVSAIKEREVDCQRLIKGLDILGISLKGFFIDQYANLDEEITEKIEQFIKVLNENVKDVGGYLHRKNHDSFYKKLFNGNKKELFKIKTQHIEEKILYIENQIAENQSSEVTKISNKIKEMGRKSKLIDPVLSRLKELIQVYEKEINLYKAKVVSAIEFPFYIYSGRITQTFNQGMGFFIDLELDKELKGVRFKTKRNTSHDALFSLSSGQLSILTMSFMLALNRVYATTKLILIDDPIQTMDDINTTSLVEVLRGDFADHHIILSTHEDHISFYMNYKFGLTENSIKCLNFKSIK